MAATGEPGYPFTAFNFEVKIDGGLEGGFSECTGLATDSDVIEYRTGTDDHTVRKIPGLKKFTNIVLKRGFMKDPAAWDWRKKVLDGQTERRSGSITLLGEDKKPVLQWTFYNGWPVKIDGPAMNAKTNEVAIQTLEIAIERLEFKVL